MTGSPEHGVVVGFDGSSCAEEALDWAAAEAVLRGVPLRIAHSWTLSPYGVPVLEQGDIAQGITEAAEALLQGAQTRVLKEHPELRVDLDLLTEGAAPGLIDLGGRADLLVVGSRGLSRFSSILIGSVSQSLVAHAPCPVVVLRGTTGRTGDRGPESAVEQSEAAATTGPAPVVLGAAPGEASAPVGFAFAEAARRGAPLLVVRAWQYPPNVGGYIAPPPGDMGLRDGEEGEELALVLADAAKEFPGVRVVQEVGMHEPAWALVDASTRACLLVVGAERRRHRFAPPIGRVAQQVLHHAHCPVAVVPHH
ncbi:universal stress protein [Streptacidiphilus sp. N1-12]|uniref:Universal stress protein n=2 Tax=Streptacidiphilus alkalitolerans TaxID=3342712 RepID=A0ABV6VD27_9ACTN